MGRKLLQQALALDPTVDAVFCNNDIIALGVLFECIARGIRVPEEMGIAGFNDHEYMATAEPPLSSLRTPRYESGFEAVIAIRRKLDGETGRQSVRGLGRRSWPAPAPIVLPTRSGGKGRVCPRGPAGAEPASPAPSRIRDGASQPGRLKIGMPTGMTLG